MKKITTKVLQKYADFLVKRLEKTKNQIEFDSIYLHALYLDNLAIRFNIELK